MSDERDDTVLSEEAVGLAAGPGDESEQAVGEDNANVVFTVRQIARTRELLARLSGARRSVNFYPRGHVVVRDSLEALMKAISEFHSEGCDVPLAFFDDEVLLGEQLLAAESMIFDQLTRDMQSSGQTSVNFVQGLTLDELERAMQVLAMDSAQIEAAGGIEAVAESASIPNVKIGTIAFARNPDDFITEISIQARETFTQALDAAHEFGEAVARGKTPSGDQVRDAVRGIVDNVLENRGAMLELSGLKSHDEYTYVHSINVTILSIALGSLVSSNRRFLSSLGVGALMHDVGKMTLELEVLNKPGPLTEAEWALMRMHPVYGAEVAAGVRGLDRASIVVILEHHMRYDLDGYPERRLRRPQHIASRIVAIADAYDAMTSKRIYAAQHRHDEALEMLAENAGTAFDPALVRAFTQMLGMYPPRSLVRLSTGEVAVVFKPNEDIFAPWVRVITDKAGVFVEPFDVDLSDAEYAGGRKIGALLDPEAHDIEVDDFLLPS